jgi:endonuclease-3
MQKQPFNIDQAITRIEEAVKPYPKAAMFELFDKGFTTPFEQLVACILSIRTYDEVSLVCAQQLFALARTPQAMAQLPIAQIDAAIGQSTFHERKAPQIHTIAQRILDEFNGDLPCDPEVLLSFQGVGLKCAHLALGIACNEFYISVDIHVHRVTNRWGYVHAKTPEQTMAALEARLPQRYWVEINRLLVPFGKHICTGRLPKCSACPVLAMCQQVGVEEHR